MGLVTGEYGDLNANLVVRVSPVIARDSDTIKTDGSAYIKKYYHLVYTAGEVTESANFNTGRQGAQFRIAGQVADNHCFI